MQRKKSSLKSEISQISSLVHRNLRLIYGDRLVTLILYGSQARGDAAAGSDIDYLIVLKDPVNPGEEISRISPLTAKLSLHNNMVISTAFVSENRYFHERSPFLLNVREEGLVL